MPIHFENHVVRCTEVVSVEDAEPLLQGLSSAAHIRVDLGACTHVHTAALQVLLAADAPVAAWPADPALTLWLQSSLRGDVGAPTPASTDR